MTKQIVFMQSFFGLIFLFVIVLTYYNVSKLDGDFNSTVYIITVKYELRNVLSELNQLESIQRGYLLTGDKSYLKYYRGVKADVLKNVSELGKFKGGILKNAGNLETAVDRKIAELDKTIKLAQNGQKQKAIEMVKTDYGEKLMSSIRKILDRYIDNISNTVKLHKKRLLKHENRMLFTIDILSGLIFMSLIFFFLILLKIARKREDELKELARKANAAKRAKSMFLANMSHEIRTPLNGLIGMIYLLQMSDLKEDQLYYVNKMKAVSEELLELINNILDYTRLETEEIELSVAGFFMDDVLDSVILQFIDEINEKGLDFYLEIDPDTPIQYRGDSMKLMQVISNLLSNAVKFTDEGFIKIKVRKERDLDGNKVELLFLVEDTGVGIDEKFIPYIFDKFTQEDQGVRGSTKGSGLGMAISKQIVEKMGGRIWVESKKNEGSKFYFTVQLERYEKDFEYPVVNGDVLSKIKAVIFMKDSIRAQYYRKLFARIGLNDVKNIESVEKLVEYIKNFSKSEKINLIILIEYGDLDDSEKQKIEQMNENGYYFIVLTNKHIFRKKKNIMYVMIPLTISKLHDILMEVTESGLKEKRLDSKYLEQEVLSDKKIMVVDDNDINRTVLADILKQFKANVVEAKNGKEAYELVDSSYDLIIMDCHMPVMDGYEASLLIRKQKQLRDLPIIALTASTLSEDSSRFVESGMNDYLLKPVDVNKLIYTLIKYLRK